MTIQRIKTGPRMSQAVVHNGVVYLAGQVCPPDAGANDVTSQTQVILKQIDELLAAAGTSKDKLLSASVWVTDMARFAEMNAVWDAWVPAGGAPARAAVEAKLAAPGYLVEIAVVAAV
jgi:enamine deaminase RidA (YjgF/YER057c/UK114 family)